MLLLLLACSQPETLMVIPDTGSGRLALLREDLRWYGEISLASAIHSGCEDADEAAVCMVFEIEHHVEDGEDLLLTSVASRLPEGEGAPGSIVDLHITDGEAVVDLAIRELDFSAFPDKYDGLCGPEFAGVDPLCSLNMIHAARWMPAHDLLVASDTSNSRVLWLRPNWDTRVGTVEAILETGHPDWERYRYPNGIHVWEEDGRVLLLTTFKSSDAREIALSNTGRVVLWDVTDPYEPVQKWAFPERGFLAAVHNATVTEVGGVRYLLYAHSLGAANDWLANTGGSVGVARYNGIDTAPTYLGDGLAPKDDTPFGFLREVEATPDGQRLLITDSGCQVEAAGCDSAPAPVITSLPALSEAGLSGAYSTDHAEQRWFWFPSQERRDHNSLRAPYEMDAFPRDSLGKGMSDL